jgi:hypothetical protein
VRRSLKLLSSKIQNKSGPSDLEGHVTTDRELQEKAKVSVETPEPEEPKSLIVVDREGGHASIDCVLWVKLLQTKESIEELRLPKAEVSKWTRAIDLKWMHDARSRTSGTEYSRGKQRVKT